MPEIFSNLRSSLIAKGKQSEHKLNEVVCALHRIHISFVAKFGNVCVSSCHLLSRGQHLPMAEAFSIKVHPHLNSIHSVLCSCSRKLKIYLKRENMAMNSP